MGFLRERRRQAPLCCRHAAATASRSHFFSSTSSNISLIFSLCFIFNVMVILVVFIIAASLFPSSWTLSDSFHLFFGWCSWMWLLHWNIPPLSPLPSPSSTAVCLFQIFLIILSTFPFIAQLAFSTTFLLSVTPSFSYPSFFSPSHLHPEEGGDAGRVNA